MVYDGYHVLESGKNAYVTILSSSRARLEVIGRLTKLKYTENCNSFSMEPHHQNGEIIASSETSSC